MTNTLYPMPRKYSYNFACDVVEKIYNPNYWDIWDSTKEYKTPVTYKSINDSVTFYYVDGDLVAMYDEVSGDLWTTKEVA